MPMYLTDRRLYHTSENIHPKQLKAIGPKFIKALYLVQVSIYQTKEAQGTSELGKV